MEIETKKRFNWKKGVLELFEVWNDNIERLSRTRRNFGIMKEMAEEMTRRGFKVTAIEVKTKIGNLTQKYKYVQIN